MRRILKYHLFFERNSKWNFSALKTALIILYCLQLLSIEGFAAEEAPLYPKKEKPSLVDLDAIVSEALAIFHVPGISIGVVVDGQVVLLKGYGFRDREKRLPVTEDTLFAIGSCTKAFTALVLGQLVEEEVLSWDDPVIQYLPKFRLYNPHATYHVTIRDLLAHRTGVPRHDYFWYRSLLLRKELLSRLRYLEPACDLRETFQYNNMMYALAGHVIEKVTGQTWEKAVESRIFTPLGMQANFSNEESQKSENFALPYAEKRGLVQPISFRNMSNIGPAGSINSSVSSMVKWLQIQLDAVEGESLIKKETIREMHTLQMPKAPFSTDFVGSSGYGLGWFVGAYKEHYLVWHQGKIDGFSSGVSLLPSKGIGVVVLSNNSCSSGGYFLVSAITNTIFDQLLGLEKVDWISHYEKAQEEAKAAMQKNREESKEPASRRPLKEYIGAYKHRGYGTINVYLEGERLVVSYNQISTPLTHKKYDAFVGFGKADDFYLSGMDFLFISDFSGEIAELHVPFEPLVDPIVFKRQSHKGPLKKKHVLHSLNS